MKNELCMNCFNVKGAEEVCPHCGYIEGTPPGQAFHLEPGTILANRYIVGTSIGFGGFGITYKAYDTVLGVIVAIKEFYPAGLVNRAPGESQVGIMSGEKTQEYEMQLKRFLIEAQSIAQFGKAKDIVNVYDYFEENNTAYIIMEYIDGILLKKYIEQEGRIDVETALYLIMPIIEALKKIHGSGIIHRDVSPDNIFITSVGSIKIFDFGAAQFAGHSENTYSEVVIKAGYAPPEQYRSKSRQGAFSDIYSVGAILYEMITGIKPVEASDRMVKDTLEPPSSLGIKLDPNLDRAIMQAMAVRPEYRFQYVEHLQEAIEDKRVAEYPEEKIRRLQKRRRLAVSLTLFSLTACIVVALVLVKRVRQGNEVVSTPLEKCELKLWVPYEGSQSQEDARKQMELLIKDFQSNSDSFEGNEKVLISCEAVSADVYAEEFDKAKEEGKEPDIYCTDFVGEGESLELHKLYELLKDEDYYGLSSYKIYHPDLRSVPFGLRTLCIYTFGSGDDSAQMDIKEILTEQQKKKVYLDERSIGTVLVLQDNSLLKSSPIALTEPAMENFGILTTYTNILGLTGGTEWIEKSSQNVMNLLDDQQRKKEGQIYAVVADTDFNKVLYNYNSQNFEQKIEYQRRLVTAAGAAVFIYRDTYAVNGKLAQDENKQLAAQRFLYLCMSQTENGVYYSGTSRVIPLHLGAWKNGSGGQSSYSDTLLKTIAQEKVKPVFASARDLNAYSREILEEMK